VDDFAWLVWPSRGTFIFNKGVQFKKSLPACEKLLPAAENINETTVNLHFCVAFLLS